MFNNMCSKFLEKIYMIWLISEDIGYFLAGFRWCQLFPSLFQIVPRWFQVVLHVFKSFQVVPRFSKYIDILIKKCSLAGAYPEDSVGRGRLRKQCHNCYAKVMGPKWTNYTKYLLIAHFELHYFLLTLWILDEYL